MEAGWAGTDLAPFEVPSGSRGVRGGKLCPALAVPERDCFWAGHWFDQFDPKRLTVPCSPEGINMSSRGWNPRCGCL